jgi:hypothetical protein
MQRQGCSSITEVFSADVSVWREKRATGTYFLRHDYSDRQPSAAGYSISGRNVGLEFCRSHSVYAALEKRGS